MEEPTRKRVSRTVTFYPNPEDGELLERVTAACQVEDMPFSDLCKLALQAWLVRRPAETNPPQPEALPAQLPYRSDLPPGLGDLSVRLAAVERQAGRWLELELRLEALEAAQTPGPPLSIDEVSRVDSPPAPPPDDPVLSRLGPLLEDF
ncbi:MAG: hypothetical protein IGQ88_10700 [Gloeomargaritaceae cyanobacterium C42_A2020_066]|nr:hypothetical protein [Gloeomargaritaceae cyanobacterium C42_A2020_066]